jgi:hypothetical protein
MKFAKKLGDVGRNPPRLVAGRGASSKSSLTKINDLLLGELAPGCAPTQRSCLGAFPAAASPQADDVILEILTKSRIS